MWYIMSYNAINGFVSGAFSDIEHLFFSNYNRHGHCEWTSLVTEARGFETQEEAEEFIVQIWGRSMLGTLMIAKRDFHFLDQGMDEHARKNRNKFDNMSLRLVAGDVEAAELACLVDKIPSDVGLTYREKWIIKAMKRN